MALLELQQPNIAGNYLSALRDTQQQQQQQQAFAAQQQQRDAQQAAAQHQQQQTDTTFEQGQQDRILGILGPLVAKVKPGDQAGWDQVIGTMSRLGADPVKLAQLKDVSLLPQIQAEFAASAPGRALANESRQQQLTDAQIMNLKAEAAKNNAAAANGGQPRAPQGYTWGPVGNLVPIPGGPADPNQKPMNDDQLKALGFANRIRAANQILATPDATNAATSYTTQGLAGVPVLGNYLAGENFQQADQAQRDFVNALLRRESGAAISESEFHNARLQYFPQPGDSPKVVEQKAVARQRALDNMMTSTGGTRGQVMQNNAANNPQTQGGIQQEYVPGGPPVGTRLPQGGQGGPVAPPPGAIQLLRSNPALAPQFDAKYGSGAAQRAMSGQ